MIIPHKELDEIFISCEPSQLETVIEAMADGITLSNENGHFEIFNSKMQEITGYNIIDANNTADFTVLIYPDAERRKEAIQRLEEVNKKGRIEEIETLIQTKDGLMKILLISTNRIKYKDQDMFLTVYHDITNRKQQEEELKRSKEKLELQTRFLEKSNEEIKNLYKERENLVNDLQEISIKDPNTGLFNYRYLIEKLTTEIKRVKRYVLPLSVVMLDIDYFKSINDVYGHQYGDIILKEFAEYLKSFTREVDTVARYGGEEFVIVLPNTNKDNCFIFAQRLLDSIKKHIFDKEDKKMRLKISIGITSFPEDNNNVETVSEVLSLVDRALLNAKEMGGNRLSTTEDINKDIEDIVKKSGKENITELRNKLSKMIKRVNQTLLESLYAFAKTIETKDFYRSEHAENIVFIVTEICKKLHISGKSIEDIKHAAVLRDLGKIGIADDILHKRESLTKEEYDTIKKHPQIGVEIIRPIYFLRYLLPIILHHHERFDGIGNSSGLAGEQIPVGARILVVADAYEALVSKRPHRNAYSREEALKIIKDESGTQFDPDIVNIFMDIMTNNVNTPKNFLKRVNYS